PDKRRVERAAQHHRAHPIRENDQDDHSIPRFVATPRRNRHHVVGARRARAARAGARLIRSRSSTLKRVLGIETSCDETSAAVLEGSADDVSLRSLVILSQDVHRIFGGVVPEIASRAHLTAIVPVVERALHEAGDEAIGAIAVTNAPGLVGALLVGVSFAKALAFARNVPVIGVHHMEGHLFATALEHREAVPPFTALLVSGGHTMLLDVEAWGRYRLLGRTRDDAAGEAFDKV